MFKMCAEHVRAVSTSEFDSEQDAFSGSGSSGSGSSGSGSSANSGGKGSSGGRPPKPPSERRTLSHGLYLSAQEKAQIKEMADAADLSINEYLRRRALERPIQPKIVRAARQALMKAATDVKKTAEDLSSGRASAAEAEQRLREVVQDAEEAIGRMME
ncbi:plasmid mobilization protein [Salinibacter ruber]|uniref:plasmid mobilization protein n=1 Tax=Salinibacter ruber TaxID=146919 RepID=UPI003C6E5905